MRAIRPLSSFLRLPLVTVPALLLGLVLLPRGTAATRGAPLPIWTMITCVAFSPDGMELASAREDGQVDGWIAATGKFVRSIRTGEVTIERIVFSPDGKYLAAGSLGRPDTVWEWKSGTLFEQGAPEQVGHGNVAFSPDGRLIATDGRGGKVFLWQVADGDTRGEWRAHGGGIYGLAFSPDGKSLVTTGPPLGAKPGDDREPVATFWDPATGKRQRTLTGASGPLAFGGPDLLATGSADQRIRIWNPRTGALLRTIAADSRDQPDYPLNPALRSIAFAPGGKLGASAASVFDALPAQVRLWDPATGSIVRDLPPFPNGVTSVAFSPDGRLLATGASRRENGNRIGETALWDPATGRQVALLTAGPKEPAAR